MKYKSSKKSLEYALRNPNKTGRAIYSLNVIFVIIMIIIVTLLLMLPTFFFIGFIISPFSLIFIIFLIIQQIHSIITFKRKYEALGGIKHSYFRYIFSTQWSKFQAKDELVHYIKSRSKHLRTGKEIIADKIKDMKKKKKLKRKKK